MKKTTMLLLLAMLSFSLQAQRSQCPMFGKGGANRQSKNQLQNRMSRLNLSPGQMEKIRNIHKDSRNRLETLRQNKQQTLQQFDDARAVIQKETKEKIKAVLTPEQQSTLAAMKRERQEKNSLRMQRKLDSMKSRLSLSENQYTRLKALQEKNIRAVLAIRENENLGPEARRTAIRQLNEASRREKKEILTPEQLEKIKEMKKNRSNREKRDGWVS